MFCLNAHQEGHNAGDGVPQDFHLRRQRAAFHNDQRPNHTAHQSTAGDEEPFETTLRAGEIGRAAKKTSPAQQAERDSHPTPEAGEDASRDCNTK